MNCIVCNKDQVDCLDYAIYERGGRDALVCTEHQPISEPGPNKSLVHTVNLRLLKEALHLTWADIDKPEGTLA